MVSSQCSAPSYALLFCSLENYDSDETQADDPDLTLVPEDEYSQLVVPDSLQPNG